MPRKPREFEAGGIYHVYNRGNNRRLLFDESQDFEAFMAILKAGQDRENVRIYHYCLMSNHYHLLVRSEEAEGLPGFMHWVQLGYARYFKKKHKTTGHIFEERYRSPRIAHVQFFSNETKSKDFESHWFCDFSSIFSCFPKFAA